MYYIEGVFCCKKECIGKHHYLEIPNIHGVKLMQSLASRGLVREKYNWQWLYYTLTDEGKLYTYTSYIRPQALCIRSRMSVFYACVGWGGRVLFATRADMAVPLFVSLTVEDMSFDFPLDIDDV